LNQYSFDKALLIFHL